MANQNISASIVSTDEVQATPKHRGFRWYHIYFLLAFVEVVTIVASVSLSHKLLHIHTDSIAEYGGQADLAADMANLVPLTAAVVGPGNDVFENGQVAQERQNLFDHVARFRQAATEVRSDIEANLEASVAEEFLAGLDVVEVGVDSMLKEGVAIFDDLDAGKHESGAAHMAVHDKLCAETLSKVIRLGEQHRDLQRKELNAQAENAARLSNVEWMIGGVVLLIVTCVGFYGHRLSKTVKAAEQREQNLTEERERKAVALQLMQAVASAANRTTSRHVIMQEVAETICRHTDWPIGHVYLPDEQNSDLLVPSEIWHLADAVHFRAFQEATMRTTFNKGSGLPGRILESGEPKWIGSLQNDSACLSSRGGHKIGIAAGFGFPVLLNNEVVAVYEFFSPQTIQPDEELLGLTRDLAEILSRVFERSWALEEIERTRIAAEAANQAKSDFLANMSHEIRTPMTAIIGNAEILQEEDQISPIGRESIATITRSGNHLLELINDILDLSKVEAGKMEVELVPCSLPQTLKQLESLMGRRATEKRVAFRIDIDGKIPETIESDPTRLNQILVNLAGNAIKFTDEGSVSVTARLVNAEPPQIEFEVRDSGIGMTPEGLSRLFQAFSQADNSTTRRFGGTGLGLRISKQLAQLLGGDITVESMHGHGSTFRLRVAAGSIESSRYVTAWALREAVDAEPDRIAVDTAAGIELPAAESRELPLQGYRVLLAEDGPDNQRLITYFLRKAGAEPVVVDNGQSAVEAALLTEQQSKPFDVVVMDMQMPILDGYGAADRLREFSYQRPVIAITAHAMAGDREKCIAAGCCDYLTKPINRNHLIEKITAVSCAPAV
jgi:signal transduction histidine kinase/CheY-like chemotaxis protein